MLEEDNDLASLENIDKNDVATNDEIEDLKRKLAENDAIIAELMFRQDSLEANRQEDLERRFDMVMRMVRNETKGSRPDLETRAENLFLSGKDQTTSVAENVPKNTYIPNGTKNDRPVNETRPKAPSIVQAPTKNQTNTTAESKIDKIQNRANAKVADTDVIKSRKFRNLDGVKDGYYVVANVYKGGQYMDKFRSALDQQGIASDYIDNPENGLKYVYLERYENWEDAASAYNSKLGGTYDGALWIMNVDNKYSNEAYASNVEKIKEKSEKYNLNPLAANGVEKDKMAAAEPVHKTFKIEGIGDGFYIIANVFANPNNAKRFVKLLNSYGLSASYFVNPENNWRYVYLKRHESWNNALISYYTKINDTYDDKMWIMRVAPNNVA